MLLPPALYRTPNPFPSSAPPHSEFNGERQCQMSFVSALLPPTGDLKVNRLNAAMAAAGHAPVNLYTGSLHGDLRLTTVTVRKDI